MMLVLAMALGLLVGLVGQVLAPAGGPALASTLRASCLGALPGGVVGLCTRGDELLLGLDPAFLVMAIAGAAFSVLSVAFVEERRRSPAR